MRWMGEMKHRAKTHTSLFVPNKGVINQKRKERRKGKKKVFFACGAPHVSSMPKPIHLRNILPSYDPNSNLKLFSRLFNFSTFFAKVFPYCLRALVILSDARHFGK